MFFLQFLRGRRIAQVNTQVEHDNQLIPHCNPLEFNNVPNAFVLSTTREYKTFYRWAIPSTRARAYL